MFGSLFEEHEASGGMTASLQSMKPPDPPRNATGLAGIENQGATCFLNCTLQVLAFTPEFRHAMLCLKEKELGRLEEKEKNKQVRQIPIQIQRLFASLMLEDRKAMSSKDLTNSFGWNEAQLSQQHDALELNQQLLDAIHRSLKGTGGESLIEKLFHFQVLYKTECFNCGRVSESKSHHDEFDLNVPVAKCPKGLEQSLSNMFCTPEVMCDSNKYFCSFCNAYVETAARTMKLRSLPPILKISLMRFDYEKTTFKRIKVMDSFPFPFELDMNKYIEDDQRDTSLYELYGVISHSGSCYGGHYTACIRDIDCLGNWQKPEPEQVQNKVSKSTSPPKSSPAVASPPKDIIEYRDPEELVSVILAGHPLQTMTMDKLSAEVYNQTGVPWSRSFKRRYGSFVKFIHDHPQRFHLVESRVSLLDSPAVKDSMTEKDDGLTEETEWKYTEIKPHPRSRMVTQSDRENKSASKPLLSDTEGTGEVSPSSPARDVNLNCRIEDSGSGHLVNGFHMEDVPPPGQRWFLFNDSNVCAMEEADLAKEFSGKKSAYLLWYRKKNMPKPQEAFCNRAYGIPNHLLEEIEQRNALLEKERLEYLKREDELKEENERKKREVNLEIRFYFYHRLEQGVLRSDEEPVRLTCERRQTLDELFQMILLLGGEALTPDFHVHRMRCWDDKSHLYDELTDRNKTLDELFIEEGTILFVWDGRQVGGQAVPVGLEAEPITLRLKKYSSALEIVHNFPKNTPLSTFRTIVSNLTGVSMESLQLQFPETLQLDDLVCSGSDDTLESIHLRDRACILFDGGSGSTAVCSESGGMPPESAAEEPSFIVHIENRCDEANSKWPVLELEIAKNMKILDVKQTYMSMYSIDCQTAAVRENDSLKGLQTPYNDDITVGEAGITSRTKLVLDNIMMTLTFKLSPEPKQESPALKVTVEKCCTVAACLLEMTQAAGIIDPSLWHLRKTNFLGEPGQLLSDTDATLFSCAVNPGDFLILEEGALLSKGLMALSVSLYPSPVQWGSNPYNIMSLSNRINDLLIKNRPTPTESASDLSLLLGEVVIDRDATLDELKEMVAELLVSQKQINVNKSQLRISLVEGKQKRLRRILRSRPYNTLRRLKVNGESCLGVQVVAEAADPSPNEIVLNLRERHQESRTYKDPEELRWDCCQEASAASLKLTIACRLRMPEETFVIAKHFPEEFQWRILVDDEQVRPNLHSQHHNSYNNRKGRRKPQVSKSNIRQKPFFVQDGDHIGVVFLTSRVLTGLTYNDLTTPEPGIRAEDFSTVDDDIGREQLLEEQRKKQNEREAKRLVGDWMTHVERRPEVPLTIKIGDFT